MKDLRAAFSEIWAVTTESQCKQAHLPAAVSGLLPPLLLQIGRMLIPSSLNTFSDVTLYLLSLLPEMSAFQSWKSTFSLVWFLKHLRSTSELLRLPSVVVGIVITKHRPSQLQKVCFSILQAHQAACAALVERLECCCWSLLGRGEDICVQWVELW